MVFVVVSELPKCLLLAFNLSLKVCYTFLIVYVNIVNTLPSNLIPPDQIDTLQPSTIPQRIYGSKLVIGEWHWPRSPEGADLSIKSSSSFGVQQSGAARFACCSCTRT